MINSATVRSNALAETDGRAAVPSTDWAPTLVDSSPAVLMVTQRPSHHNAYHARRPCPIFMCDTQYTYAP
jgi:hypothetical protein